MKRLMAVVCMIVFMGFFAGEHVQASEHEPRYWPEVLTSDSVMKEWRIVFNEPVDERSLDRGGIYLADEFGFLFDDNLTFTLEDDQHTVVVHPPEHGYERGRNYQIHMTETVMARSGQALPQELIVPFEISRFDDGSFTFGGLTIGDARQALIDQHGEPDRIDASRHGFEWYVYNSNYEEYMQVGVDEEMIVAMYSNTLNWQSDQGITVGSPREEVIEHYRPVVFNHYNPPDLVEMASYSAYLFYDVYEGNTVSSVYMLHGGYNIYESVEADERLIRSMERQTFDLANAARVKAGLDAYANNEVLDLASRAHSQDMAENHFYSHVNLQGESPSDRVRALGLNTGAGENIYMSPRDAIFAHEGWMHSEGHRRNILNPRSNALGTGLAYNEEGVSYYTQKFATLPD